VVIIELQGGLGNQMFQYACGAAFALKHNKQLLIDTSFLDQNQAETGDFTPRKFELNIFDLKAEIADKKLVQTFGNNFISKKVCSFLKLPHKKCYTEDTTKNPDQLKKVAPPVLLKGYWQSEQYFAGYEEEIKKTFSFIAPSSLNNTITSMGHTNAVSIHYRRGDYLTNPLAQKVLGVLDAEYYQNAIERIKEKIENPFFYIFSDDTGWVENNPPTGENCQIMDRVTPEKHWHDMLLMSKCRHHIIANSSFSWWAAWLNSDPKKMVIAPKRWFADEHMNANTTDLIPTTWTRI
jgi:hypothetical protein